MSDIHPLFKKLLEGRGYFHKKVDARKGGLLGVRKEFLDEAKKKAKKENLSPEDAVIAGWNACCEYDKIHERYYDSFRLWSDRNPPVNY